MSQKPDNSVHGGHRARMRERMEKAGVETLADHELLEVLLYYVQPRRDTNETAHALIEECGSLTAVLEAKPERLCRVKGVKDAAGTYLRLVGEISRRYAAAKFRPAKEPYREVYDSPDKVAAIMYPRFLGKTTEQLYALLFDSGMHMVDLCCVAEGTLNGVAVTPRAVTERAYRFNASSVILAHNHPGGVALPSPEDIRLTTDMETALELLGVPLVEHFIFTDTGFCPIIANRYTDRHPAAYSAAAQYRNVLWSARSGKE